MASVDIAVHRTRSSDLIAQVLPDGSTAIFEVSTKNVYSLNPSAAAAWEACASATSLSQIAIAMSRKLGVPVSEELAHEAVSELAAVGLVTVTPGESLGTSRREMLKVAGMALPVALVLTGIEQRAHAQSAVSPPMISLTQITNTSGGPGRSDNLSISAAGTRIAFVSTTGFLGSRNEIVLFDTTTSTFTQITNTGGSNLDPSINAAGTRIAFQSDGDLTPGSPGNADGNIELFLFDTTTSTFTQITNTDFRWNRSPSINAAGTRIAFESSPAGIGPSNISLFDTTTSTFTQITNTSGGLFANISPSINADGTRIAFQSDGDLTPGSPGNADGNFELFLFDTTTSTFTQITNTIGGGNGSPSMNATGTRIAFASNRDLTPGNPGNADGNEEIFLFDTTTSTFTQITNTVGGYNIEPSINAAGTRIAFVSSRDLTPGSPGNADGNSELFLFDTTTSTFTQITNTSGGLFGNISPSINATGTRIAFKSDRDLTPGSPGNADGSLEIFLARSGPSVPVIRNSSGGSRAVVEGHAAVPLR